MKKLFIFLVLLSIVLPGITQDLVKIRECVIENGVLKQLEVDYSQATGDRTVLLDGVRKNFHDIYPKTGKDYAESQKWYIDNDPVAFNGRSYVKYGLPRILGVVEVEKAGSNKGVGVYIESGLAGKPEVIYIPVRQGCEFQPYQVDCGWADIANAGSTATTMQFTVKTGGLSGKISYKWESPGAPIIKGQGTATITVDITNKKNNDGGELSVTATDANQCPVRDYHSFGVKKN